MHEQPLILDGKALSAQIREELAQDVAAFIAAGGKQPHLAAILVGDDGASQTYVKSKVKGCEQTGMRSTLLRFPSDTTEAALLNTIHELNNDADIDGFIVQLPLPKHIDELKVTLAIDPAKDVDGFHPENAGRIQLGLPAFVSATPMGIMTMLERYGIATSGKHCVVVGRSNIVGTPISILLSRNAEPGNCTVTLCHSRTDNISAFCREADIIVAAVGRPHFIKADMVKRGAVVIDVGITRVDADNEKGYVIQGDVDYDNVAPLCSAITPVPGGVGVMTVTSLLINTLQAAKNKLK
ncbi:MAG: bifunctional 5,10-methylene-tetrahydrofolate dehydrogenase/5,10-methylene-tetrahydrofolate cyclohydrolase [Sphingobacteriales bacterium BACL12 MAG-120813-bin55]|jgi:methylenetetrahydrofolate dehydrogenase (NADP+)/methenyltetrahydrofolate cyclohydrolase|nr:MAG: bifunctional 5,10-methylene-tetrahydrofolate dehydrogenase/5,10-methylene-tetrahydrofolate cyclohydrolase [Sphingobacteriales bacterium BACL12 MAG-120813-bin55]